VSLATLYSCDGQQGGPKAEFQPIKKRLADSGGIKTKGHRSTSCGWAPSKGLRRFEGVRTTTSYRRDAKRGWPTKRTRREDGKRGEWEDTERKSGQEQNYGDSKDVQGGIVLITGLREGSVWGTAPSRLWERRRGGKKRMRRRVRGNNRIQHRERKKRGHVDSGKRQLICCKSDYSDEKATGTKEPGDA